MYSVHKEQGDASRRPSSSDILSQPCEGRDTVLLLECGVPTLLLFITRDSISRRLDVVVYAGHCMICICE